MEYTVLIHPADEGGYWVEVPALPGCFSQGETVEEAIENSRDAIESYILALKEDHKPAPLEKDILIGKVSVEIAA